MGIELRRVTQLTDTTDDGPVFLPNGRMIMYATRLQGREALMTTTTRWPHQNAVVRWSGDIREPVGALSCLKLFFVCFLLFFNMMSSSAPPAAAASTLIMALMAGCGSSVNLNDAPVIAQARLSMVRPTPVQVPHRAVPALWLLWVPIPGSWVSLPLPCPASFTFYDSYLVQPEFAATLEPCQISEAIPNAGSFCRATPMSAVAANTIALGQKRAGGRAPLAECAGCGRCPASRELR